MEKAKRTTKEAKVVVENKVYDRHELVSFEFNEKAPYHRKGVVELITGEQANIFLKQGYGVVCND